MAVSSFSSGMTPASEFLSALTITMKRIFVSPTSPFALALLSRRTNTREIDSHLLLDFRRSTYILVGMVARTAAGQKPARGPRDPERTRAALLLAAFKEVHRSGFRGTDLDTILDAAGVTKGALYHHFEDKEALGYALVEESLTALTREKWLRPLEDTTDPIHALVQIVQSTLERPEDVRCGCPLNNLAQEMSPLDEGFRKRLKKVFELWQEGIAVALRDGQKRGVVRSGVDPNDAATFLVATYEGYISLAKNAQDARVLQSGKKRMTEYLESLRAGPGRAKPVDRG
jgi:AcrR family transcriptional regulator